MLLGHIGRLVSQLGGYFVVEHGAIRRAREKKRKRKKKINEGARTGAPSRKFIPFRAWPRGNPYIISMVPTWRVLQTAL